MARPEQKTRSRSSAMYALLLELYAPGILGAAPGGNAPELGTSESSGTRVSVNTASGLTVPSLTCGSAGASDTISKCIRLVIRSIKAGGRPF
jgi:hypothetical protein